MTKFAVVRNGTQCGEPFDTHAEAFKHMEDLACANQDEKSYAIRRVDAVAPAKPGPSPLLTQALRDSLAIEEGQSPLAEANPASLDELYDRINRKLVQGLVLDIHDGDILAIVADLRAKRLQWVQEQQRNEGKPRKRTPRSVTEALSQVSASEVEI
jgi:hypothetical protein